jgi:hypothetical protein
MERGRRERKIETKRNRVCFLHNNILKITPPTEITENTRKI